jgi:hypothetical protein
MPGSRHEEDEEKEDEEKKWDAQTYCDQLSTDVPTWADSVANGNEALCDDLKSLLTTIMTELNETRPSKIDSDASSGEAPKSTKSSVISEQEKELGSIYELLEDCEKKLKSAKLEDLGTIHSVVTTWLSLAIDLSDRIIQLQKEISEQSEHSSGSLRRVDSATSMPTPSTETVSISCLLVRNRSDSSFLARSNDESR